MKEGWEIKKLGEVCEISTGNANTEDAVENGEYAFFDRSKVIKRSSSYLFDCEAIIIAGEGATFLPKFYSGKFNLHQRAYAIFNFNKTLDIQFANKYLIHFHKYFEQVAVGATVKSLRLRHFQELPIPLPPLSEQQRIVAILDECFTAIAKAKANAEQNLKNAKELFESYLQGVFENKGDGWEERRIGELCNVIGGGTPSKANSKFYDGEIYWATVRDMKGEIISDTEHKITKEAVKNSSTNIIPKGNVIIATRVGLGKVCLIDNDTAINQDLRGIVPINLKKLLVNFLYHWFKSISHKIVEEGTGATVQGVKLPFIKSLAIPLPSIKEQQTIVRQLDALRTETQKLETVYKKKINDLEELKKSILQKAFNGELPVGANCIRLNNKIKINNRANSIRPNQ